MQIKRHRHHQPHPCPLYATTFLTRLSGLARASKDRQASHFIEQARDNTHVSMRFRLKPVSGGTSHQ